MPTVVRDSLGKGSLNYKGVVTENSVQAENTWFRVFVRLWRVSGLYNACLFGLLVFGFYDVQKVIERLLHEDPVVRASHENSHR